MTSTTATSPLDVRTTNPDDNGRHHQAAPPFTGGKNGEGVYQTIINQMPPHQHYVELFAGAGAIIKHKRPAAGLNVAIEADADTAARLHLTPPRQVRHADAFTFLTEHYALLQSPDVLIYADPPYPLQTRQGRRYYALEMTDAHHARLLKILTHARAMVLISGYRCPLYDRALPTWRRIDYRTMTRGGSPRIESLWCNFPQPKVLHDYQFLGDDFRERERIHKLIRRWTRRLEAMPPLQRAALLDALHGRPAGDPPVRQK